MIGCFRDNLVEVNKRRVAAEIGFPYVEEYKQIDSDSNGQG